MAKTKSKTKAKEKKYVSPWAITKKNVGYYTNRYSKPGGEPVDFTKLKERLAARPGQGAPRMNKGEILNEQKELKNG